MGPVLCCIHQQAEVVTALWKEGTWCYIQYSATIDLAFAE